MQYYKTIAVSLYIEEYLHIQQIEIMEPELVKQ